MKRAPVIYASDSEKLRLHEKLFRFPFMVLCWLLMALPWLVGIFTGYTDAVVATGIALDCFGGVLAPLWLEVSMDCDLRCWLLKTRETRWSRHERIVRAIPHGDYVTVYLIDRSYGRFEYPTVTYSNFHADEGADAAHEYRAAFLAKRDEPTGPSSEAKALANVLSAR